MRTAIERLAVAIGYPERLPDGALDAVFRVDGAEISASIVSGRIVLVQKLGADPSLPQKLAVFATGRMMREDAVLAFGDGEVFLWQDEDESADGPTLLRLFESFADSCDWWRSRIDSDERSSRMDDAQMLIRP